MDIREKIDHLLIETIRAAEMRQGCTNHTFYAEKVRNRILVLIKEAGYVKVDGEPPVLSDKEVEELVEKGIYLQAKPTSMGELHRIIQRDADMKFWGGKE